MPAVKKSAKSSKSDKRWLQAHARDEFVLRAQREGWRSRAAFKLMALQEKDRLLKPGMCVVELGAAPGGWTQVARRLLGDHGRLIALDRLPFDALSGVEFIQGDFTRSAVPEQLLSVLDGRAVDVVLSDMAPDLSGNNSIDQPRTMYLCELALDLACRILRRGGAMAVKSFHGEGFEAYVAEVKRHFDKTAIRKPKASRDRSRECYIVATGFRATGV